MQSRKKSALVIAFVFYFMWLAWFVWINLQTDLQLDFQLQASCRRRHQSEGSVSQKKKQKKKKAFCHRLQGDVLKFWHFWGLNVLKLGFGFICSRHLCWSYQNNPNAGWGWDGVNSTVECDSLRHLSVKQICPHTSELPEDKAGIVHFCRPCKVT